MKLTTARASFLLANLVLLGGAAGCYVAEPGVNGKLEFIPSDCGTLVCNFDDRLAVGATTAVTVELAGGGDAGDVELISSDPSVFEVIDRDPLDAHRFVLCGNGPGIADLVGIDGTGAEVDFARIAVAVATDVELTFYGDVVGPTAMDPFTDAYATAPGTSLSLEARPAADGGPLMGVTPFAVTIDAELDAALDAADRIDLGTADFAAPIGGHALTFTAPGGATRTALLSAE